MCEFKCGVRKFIFCFFLPFTANFNCILSPRHWLHFQTWKSCWELKQRESLSSLHWLRPRKLRESTHGILLMTNHFHSCLETLFLMYCLLSLQYYYCMQPETFLADLCWMGWYHQPMRGSLALRPANQKPCPELGCGWARVWCRHIMCIVFRLGGVMSCVLSTRWQWWQSPARPRHSLASQSSSVRRGDGDPGCCMSSSSLPCLERERATQEILETNHHLTLCVCDLGSPFPAASLSNWLQH